MNPSPVQASIIIPSYNGAHRIGKTLESLTHQSFRAFEVIVVIDGSTDQTEAVVAAWQSQFKHLEIIVQNNKGRSGSRNTGAARAQTGLLIFLDDDIRIDSHVIEEHFRFHQNHPSGCILTGNAVEKSEEAKTDVEAYKAWLSEQWTGKFNQPDKPLSGEDLFLIAAHFSIPAKIFNNLNGFDESLTDAEDYDLAVRACESGIDVYFRPELRGWHYTPITAHSFVKRQVEYQRAHQQLEKQYAQRYATNKFRLKTGSGLRKWIFAFFGMKCWLDLIDSHSLLMILPRFIRYRLYSYIITGNIIRLVN